MLLIKTTTGKSSIQGIGLFSAEQIVKGQPIWIKGIQDIVIKMGDVPEDLRDYLDKYATVDGNLYRRYNLDGDDCKYMNHSDNPNICFINDIGLALCDIEINEELTCDYREITIPEHFEYLMTRE